MNGAAGGREWRRAKCEGGACAEAVSLGSSVLVRSSLRPDDLLAVSPDGWRDFVARVKGDL